MKVLYVPDHEFTMTGLNQRLSDFTLYNGCYPKAIQMLSEGIDHYQSLLFWPSDRDKLVFNGIKIVEKK